MEPTVSLTPEQLAFFKKEGYLALPPLTTPEEVAQMRNIYDRLFAQKVGREEGNQFDLAGTDEEGKEAKLPQILTPSRYAPELLKTQLFVNADYVAKQLLGPECRWTGDHAIMKPGLNGASTPWHQDEAYWGPEFIHNAISIWVPLQDVATENGCMWFVPGSQTWEVLPHHSVGHDPRVHALEIDHADTSTAVCCPLQAGGCTIHPSRTLHYTAPNQSTEPRRAYILMFGTPPKKLDQPRDFYWNRMKKTARDERAAKFAEQQMRLEDRIL